MTTLFESLLPKLAAVLELIQQSEGAATPQTKQALVQATNDFRESLRQAREYAATLPGGDVSVQEQDEVVEMLQVLRERKRQQLAEFAANVGTISTASVGANMEVDSTASTPAS